MSGFFRRLGAFLLLPAVLGVGAPGVSAQAGDTTAASAVRMLARPSPGPWGAVSVIPRPGTTVTGVSIVLPVGSSADPEDGPGTAWLLGRAVEEDVRAALPPEVRAAAEVAVEVGRDRTTLRAVTAPEHWHEVVRAAQAALFGAGPAPSAVATVRGDRGAVLRFETDAPSREFEIELYRHLGRGAPAWARPPQGDPGALEDVDREDLETFRERHLRQDAAVLSLVGGVDRLAAYRLLSDSPAPMDGVTTRVGYGEGQRPIAWRDGGRSVLTRDVTSSWIGAAWPVDPAADPTAVEMLVHRLDEAFNTEPPDPGLFHADVRLEHVYGAPVLLVRAAVLPEATRSWEQRIVRAVETLREEEPAESFFRWQRRRFRSARLLAEAAPEDESLRRAVDLLETGRVRTLHQAIWQLDREALRRAASALAEPRILVFGPDLSEQGG